MDQSIPSVCLRQTKCRSIVSEEETRGTQNKVVSVNGSSSQARVTPCISFAEVDSLSVVEYAVHHCMAHSIHEGRYLFQNNLMQKYPKLKELPGRGLLNIKN